MRRILLLATLALAACSGTPQPQPRPIPVASSPQIRGGLLGLTAGELTQRFGVPALQVREGTGVKFQFRHRACVLDAYLYPPLNARGPERVTHIDARNRAGTDTDQAGCIAALQGA